MSELPRFPADELAVFYLQAKSMLVKLGYGSEIDYHDRLNFDSFSETDFLREAGWVVLSSGMRETVVRSKFGAVSAAFLNWRSSKDIVAEGRNCISRALRAFNNAKKMDAIWQICCSVYRDGMDRIKRNIKELGVDFIATLPYMGPATSCHLAKNLGILVVKPDRHLVRISKIAGYNHPMEMCKDIERYVGDRLSVIDLVLWRYSTLFDYENLFKMTCDSSEGPTCGISLVSSNA
jgi:hypothetical protein